jgi:hypothetical protein
MARGHEIGVELAEGPIPLSPEPRTVYEHYLRVGLWSAARFPDSAARRSHAIYMPYAETYRTQSRENMQEVWTRIDYRPTSSNEARAFCSTTKSEVVLGGVGIDRQKPERVPVGGVTWAATATNFLAYIVLPNQGPLGQGSNFAVIVGSAKQTMGTSEMYI